MLEGPGRRHQTSERRIGAVGYRIRLAEPQVTAASHPSDGAEVFDTLGLPLSLLGFERTLARLLEAPVKGERLRVHFCALHTLVEAAKDEGLRTALSEGDILTPDGAPLVWLGRLNGHQVERVCGPDMMLALLERTQERGDRHFFYGSSDHVLADLVARLSVRFPALGIAGAFSPPYRPLTPSEVEDAAEMINASGADYVWVGLGSPKQDQWLADFRPRLKAAVLLGVGAAFDFHSGRVKRAPRWAQRAGVEWLFRIAAEPRRLTGRYLSAGLQFGALLIADTARHRYAGKTGGASNRDGGCQLESPRPQSHRSPAATPEEKGRRR